MGRPGLAVIAATVLALTASGCVTVHGEQALIPAASPAEAAQALQEFTAAYNKADKAYDPALDADRVTGPLGEINQAGLRSRQITTPGGNKNHTPLELTDAKFVVPRKAGWPRWFVADTDSNRDTDKGPNDTRWLLVFVRNSAAKPWEVAYLSILSPDEVPAFRTEEGYAVPVAAGGTGLAVAPGRLGERYVSYLKDGQQGPFAPGSHTTGWRTERTKAANRPGLATQYVDQAESRGDFAPLALATEDGGALVFFATRYFERQTAAPGYRPKVGAEVRALMTGEIKNTITKRWVSSQTALVKPAGTQTDGVEVLGRLQGVTAAEGS
ncbi:hypothetical protein KV205_03080 [Streptomyces sp. SKN60]|uniref:hypothetical protein n=1 Tax=Streptomyces sp. SKN60 TaxID=2855506 RepID=UPI002247D768|nr:hypothetical protein [Streptomyces sp. SKN60]MCX2179517.1 hypothetical protein [Streptomyces sp. SKN60]